jgi:hypothetical protein
METTSTSRFQHTPETTKGRSHQFQVRARSSFLEVVLLSMVSVSVLLFGSTAIQDAWGDVTSLPPQLGRAIAKLRIDAAIVARDDIDWKSCQPPEQDQV